MVLQILFSINPMNQMIDKTTERQVKAMDIPAPEIILLIGIPASGKSTFYRQRFAETHLQISLDILHSRVREMEVLQAALAAGKSCVIDNTNVTAEERARFIAPARDHAYRITGYYFRSVLAECLPRNAQRSGKERIPESGMKGRAAQLELPSRSEGFDSLYYVMIKNGQFEIENWMEEPDGKV